MARQVEDGERFFNSAGKIYFGWWVVLASILVLALSPATILIMSFGMFLPQLHSQFSWSIQSISFGAMMISLVVMVISPLQGYLADRVGPRVLIMISIPCFGMGVAALYFMGNHIALFYLACILLPIAGLGLWPLSFMKMTSGWFDRRLGLALGAINVGPGLGATLLPIFLKIIFDTYNWRVAYLCMGFAVLIAIWPIAYFGLREKAAPTKATILSLPLMQINDGMTLREAIRSNEFRIMMGGFFILGILSAGFVIHQLNILLDTGISRRTAFFLQSLLCISSIFGRLIAGWLLDKISAGCIMAVNLVVISIVCGLYTSTWVSDIAVAGVIAFGFMIGSEMNILGYMVKRYHGGLAFGKIYGLNFSAFQLGGALGAVLLGVSRAQFGSYHPGLYLFSLLALVGGILFLRLGPYYFEAKPAAPGKARDTVFEPVL